MMKAPRIPTLFKLGRKDPKQFNYEPRFYNERKERIEKRTKEIETEVQMEERLRNDENFRARQSEQENWLRFERTRRNKQSNFRLLIILFALLFFTYLIFQKLDIYIR